MMSRAGMFRVSEGIAVDMNNRVFKLPSFHGIYLNMQSYLTQIVLLLNKSDLLYI